MRADVVTALAMAVVVVPTWVKGAPSDEIVRTLPAIGRPRAKARFRG